MDPATPPELIEYVLHLCDIVLLMTVNPGFGGQPFLSEMLPKIERLRAICALRGVHPIIKRSTAERTEQPRPRRRPQGATAIVAGSAIFGTKNYAGAIAEIRAHAAAAAAQA